MGTAQRNLGLVALRQGNVAEAQALFQQSLDTFSGIVTGWDIGQVLIYLGEATAKAGNLLDAERIFLEALHEATEAQTAPLSVDALIGLAYVQAAAGEIQQAAELSIKASSHPASTQQTKDRANQLLVQLESQLTPQQVQVARARAQAKPLETLVAELLAVPRLDLEFGIGS